MANTLQNWFESAFSKLHKYNGAVIAILTLVYVGGNFVALHMISNSNKQNNTMALLMQWDKMVEMREAVVECKYDDSNYWRRYWFLQQEQYYLWKRDMVLDEWFKFWMTCRKNEWQQNKKLSGKTYRESFQQVVSEQELTPDFVSHMNKIFNDTSLKYEL